MNKTLTIFILLITFTFQNLYAQKHVFRPAILLNFNGIYIVGDDNVFWNPDNGTIWGTGGISYGAYVSYDRYKKVVGTLELRYIRKGSLYEFTNEFGQRDFEQLKLKYIEIPMLIGLKGSTKKRDYIFETGPGIAMLINSRVLYDELYKRVHTPNAGDFKKLDLSWIVDFKYYLGNNNSFLLGLRFETSILSIHNSYHLRNLSFGFELNYLLFNNKL